ncbi:ABC transporter permease [Hazenella coriacea]|uniref:ABC-2 family transporter n=1 Tax=Hazenella coriacea TaxID=1179467 RepID=A0A4R3LF27_9BACL|nr:ABC transporter permease subunit [Hazenella coriacea]TCS96974.1 ABC-2 family transporter [Hazenella coriacea]
MNKLLLNWLNNPVLLKEYQWRMRTRKTPWILFFYLLITGGILISMVALSHFLERGVKGPEDSLIMFIGLCVVQIIVVAFVVPGITSGLISGERERQTLPVLLTTNLTSSQIVVSKWLAALSFMLLLFFSSLPLYMVIYQYGGVSMIYIVKVVLHLFVTMIFLGSLGVFYSALFKRSGLATILSYITVAVLGIGIIIVYFMMVEFSRLWIDPNQMTVIGFGKTMETIGEVIASLHPVLSISYVFPNTQFNFLGRENDINMYWVYILVYTLLSSLLVIGSVYFMAPNRFQWFKKRGKPKTQEAKDS